MQSCWLKKVQVNSFDHLSHQKCSWPYFNLRSFSPNYGKIPQFTGFVNKDWIVEKVAQKATHPGARYIFELTYHHSLGTFFQLAIRNSVMQPCAAFHSTLRSCFTGDSSLEQVVHMLPKAEHTHTQFQKRCPYSNAYIHTDVVSNGIWKVDPPMYANHCHVNAPNAPTFTTTVSLATKQHFSSMKLMSKGTVVDLYGTNPYWGVCLISSKSKVISAILLQTACTRRGFDLFPS